NGGPAEWTWRVQKECSEVPVFPQGGTWIYDRAGWCPGDPTDLEEFPLDGLANAGDTVNIDYGINTISNPGDTRYLTSHLLVGYGSTNYSLDAAVTEVRVPSDQTVNARYNPACSQPIVIIRNEGSTPLTSLEITYQVRGGTPLTYSWTGNLAFLETEEVALPLNAQTFWSNATANIFDVSVSLPNGGTDLQPDNDAYASPFEPWASYQGGLKITWRTNNNGSQTKWKVYDDQGAVVAQNNIFLGPNIIYNDDLNLPAGCYKLRFDDSGDNGLYFWAQPQNGAGYARLLEYGSIRQVFEPEFGGFFEHHFWTDGLVNGEEVSAVELIRVWPNPSQDRFHVRLEGFSGENGQLEVYDALGKRVWFTALSAKGNAAFAEEVVNLSDLPAGTYLLKILVGDVVRVKRLQRL
ncbi:MAG TPA: T9SS type A sorting domain-containing protein, partial [Bacteroidetes bacterium]|nr:T9SS type A sorting domain-containing protein [Bacteroidota bacterium]